MQPPHQAKVVGTVSNFVIAFWDLQLHSRMPETYFLRSRHARQAPVDHKAHIISSGWKSRRIARA